MLCSRRGRARLGSRERGRKRRLRGRWLDGSGGLGRLLGGALGKISDWFMVKEEEPILSWGVTVVKAVRKERKRKTEKEVVMQSPILIYGEFPNYRGIWWEQDSPRSRREPNKKQRERSSREQVS